MKTALPTVLLILVAGCSANVDTRDDTANVVALPDSIALERTVCFGRCPAYRLRISAAGAVRFDPLIPQGAPGTDTIAPSAFRGLVAELAAADFDSFPPKIREDRALCARQATDHPSAIITVYRGTDSKIVDDYTGCAADENDAASARRLMLLRRLPARIDSVAGAARWIRPVELR